MTRCYLLCRPIEQGLEGEAVLQGEVRWSLQYSCLEISMDTGAWEASPPGHKELDTTEQLSLSPCTPRAVS